MTEINEHCIQLGLTEAVDKANEVFRMMDLKVPPGALKTGEISRWCYAIEIACEQLDLPYNRDKIMSRAPQKAFYQQNLVICKNLLGLNETHRQSTLQKLGIQYNAPTVREDAKKFLIWYKTEFLSKLIISDINKPVYHAASFYLISKLHKLSISKSKILESVLVDRGLFNSVYDAFEKAYETYETIQIDNTSMKISEESSHIPLYHQNPYQCLSNNNNIENNNNDNNNINISLNRNGGFNMKTNENIIRQKSKNRSRHSKIIDSNMKKVIPDSLEETLLNKRKQEAIIFDLWRESLRSEHLKFKFDDDEDDDDVVEEIDDFPNKKR